MSRMSRMSHIDGTCDGIRQASGLRSKSALDSYERNIETNSVHIRHASCFDEKVHIVRHCARMATTDTELWPVSLSCAVDCSVVCTGVLVGIGRTNILISPFITTVLMFAFYGYYWKQSYSELQWVTAALICTVVRRSCPLSLRCPHSALKLLCNTFYKSSLLSKHWSSQPLRRSDVPTVSMLL